MNTSKLFLSAAALAVGAVAIGCGPSRPVFKGDGYHDADRAYQIISVDGSGALLSPTKWSLTNYENVGGQVGARKDTPEYAVWQRFDTTGDGSYDTEMRQPLYDVLLVSREGPAKMWVRTEPVAKDKAELAVEALARAYVEIATKSGTLPAAMGKPFAHGGTAWVMREVSAMSATLDGAEAYEITFDYAADEAGLDGDGATRAQVVLSLPGFTTKLGDMHRKTALIATYTNTVADFDAKLADFQNLLGRIALLTHEELIKDRASELFECRGTSDEIEVSVKLADNFTVDEAIDKKEGEVVEDAGRTCASVILSDAPFRRIDPKSFSVRLTPGPVPVPAGGYMRNEPAPPPPPPAPAAPVEGAEGVEGAAPADGAAPAEGAAAPAPAGAKTKAPAPAGAKTKAPPPPEPAP